MASPVLQRSAPRFLRRSCASVSVPWGTRATYLPGLPYLFPPLDPVNGSEAKFPVLGLFWQNCRDLASCPAQTPASCSPEPRGPRWCLPPTGGIGCLVLFPPSSSECYEASDLYGKFKVRGSTDPQGDTYRPSAGTEGQERMCVWPCEPEAQAAPRGRARVLTSDLQPFP